MSLELETCRQQLAGAITRSTKLEQELGTKYATLNNMQRILKEHITMFRDLEDEKRRCKGLECQPFDTSQGLKEAQDETAALKGTVDQLADQLDAAKCRLAEQHSELEATKQELGSRIKMLLEENAKTKRVAEVLQKQVERQAKELKNGAEQTSHITAEFIKGRDELVARLEAAAEEKEFVEQRAKELNAEVEKCRQRIKQDALIVEEFKVQQALLKNELAAKERELTEKLELVTSDLEQERSQGAEFRVHADAVTQGCDEAMAEVDRFRTENKGLRMQLEEIQRTLYGTCRELETVRDQLIAEQRVTIKIREELQVVRGEKQGIEALVDQLRGESESARQAIDDLKAQVAQCHSDVAKRNEELGSAVINFEGEREAMLAQLNNLEGRLDVVTNERDLALQRTAELNEEVKRSSMELAMGEIETTRLLGELREIRAQWEESERQMRGKQDAVVSELAAEQRKGGELSRRLDEVNNHCQVLQNEVAQLRANNSGLEARNGRLSRQVGSATSSVSELLSEIDSIKARLMRQLQNLSED